MPNEMYVIPTMLDAYVMALNEGRAKFNMHISREGERDETVFHCSETLGCKRKRIFRRIKASKEPNNPVSMRRFLLGDCVEAVVRNAVSWSILNIPDFKEWKAELQLPVHFPEWETKGSCDILLTEPSGFSALTDIKSCHSGKIDYVRNGEHDMGYLGQLTSYRMGLTRQGKKIASAYLTYIDKDTMSTFPDFQPRGFEDIVMTDYAELMRLWKRYQATKEVPAELPFQTERERWTKRKRYTTPGGAGMFPQWLCDPRYCQFIKNCKNITAWWKSHEEKETS